MAADPALTRTVDPAMAVEVAAAADWTQWVRERQQRTESALERALPAPAAEPSRLHRAMRYSVLGGGKRMRALLAYAAAEAVGARPLVGATLGARLWPVDATAAALELLHAYSLIHDDLPCMDDDVLRRGKPTCHIEFDEATALLAGDALQALAFDVVLGGSEGLPAEARLRIAGAFARAAGPAGMAGGQAVDLASVGRTLGLAELEAMHRLKTGALIRAAVEMGARCGPAPADTTLAALDRYASAVGLAFQAVDDVLDVESTAEQLGKTPGKDALQNKPTYVSLLGLDAARERARTLHREAASALEPVGPPARRLAQLADWIVLRRH